MKTTPHIVVVGGGISGLAAAWRLANATSSRNHIASGCQPRITVLEAGSRMGGKLQTTQFAGLPVDLGPDAFLGRHPQALQLAEELGLRDELLSPTGLPSFLWNRGKLRPIPEQGVMGVPSSLRSIVKSRTLSTRGVARATLDYVLPPTTSSRRDHSVREVVQRRLGSEVLERLVEPLIGGINAGTTDHLSVAATAPQIDRIHTLHRSLIRGARKTAKQNANKPKGPMFFATPNGMATFVDTLTKKLVDHNVEQRTETSVTEVVQTETGWKLTLDNSDTINADGVIFATPAFVTGQLLNDIAPTTAKILSSIDYATVTIVRVAYDRSAVKADVNASGYLAAAVDGGLVTACSIASSKWRSLNKPDQVILRISVGRDGDERASAMTDAQLISAVHSELQQSLRVTAGPLEADVTRWNKALPQYRPGHRDRIEEAKKALGSIPTLAIAGAALEGLGIPACVKSANTAAERMLRRFC